MRKLQKYGTYIVFFGLAVFFAITRLWKLTTLPPGIHADEAGMAYDAWSLAHYGVDRWLKSWPVYMTNMGTGQSSLYAFVCAGLFRIFDYSVVMMRLPSVMFSFFTFVCGMLIARRQYPERPAMPFLAGVLVAACPYFILASRLAMDCNLMLGMSAIFLYCFIRAVSDNETLWYAFAGVAGGLTLYSYALSYLILPIFLLLAFLYVWRVGRLNFKGWVLMAIPLAALAFPLILVQCVNAFDWPEMHLGIFTITKLGGYRAKEFSRFTMHKFSRALRVIFCGDELDYNTAPGYWNLYGITVVFFIVGAVSALVRLFQGIWRKKWDISAVILLWFLAVLFLGCHLQTDVHRLNAIFLCYALLAVEGIAVLWERLANPMWRRVLVGGVLFAYVLLFLDFGHYYYGSGYTGENYPLSYFDITVSEAVQYLEEHPEVRGRATYVGGGEIFLALSMLESPYELRLYEEDGNLLDYWYCGGLGAPEEGCNYIVWDKYAEYMDELRALGYQEVAYPHYSLFYRK